jgi:rRNA maturation RNase YbeY
MISFNGQKNILKGKILILKDTIKTIAIDKEYKINSIDYILVSDEELLKINQESLNHDYYTDIITFDYTDNNVLEGEIYISVDRVKENSIKFKEMFHVELARVIFHGVLHMVGYKDKIKGDADKMRARENHYLKEYLKKFHVEQ